MIIHDNYKYIYDQKSYDIVKCEMKIKSIIH